MTTSQHDWPMVKLGDVADFVRGVTFKKQDAMTNPADDTVPILRAGNISGGSVNFGDLLYLPSALVSDKQLLRNNDIVVVMSSGSLQVLGKSGRYAPDAGLHSFGAFLCAVRPDDSLVDPSFVFHYLQSAEFMRFVQRTGKGANINNLRMSELMDSVFPLPPLEEQHRIADILDRVAAVEAKVAAQKNALATLLGPVLASASRGAYKKRLEEIARVGTGATPSRKIPGNFSGNIPWVKTTEVNGRAIARTEEHISSEALQNTSCKLNRIGSSIVAMYGQGATRGRAGMLMVEAATNQACAVISPHQQADDYYVFKCLVNSYEDLRGLGRGGTQPNLNLSLVKSFEIPFPQAEDRSRATEFLQCADDIENQLGRTLQLISELKNALATRAFQGEL
ncbi:hypothetical protein F8377_07385 [Corynebacterium zhongnanshanii]|uniref:Type I restriction modification DNA specificity domain-containing protein n=1 Tax=Corynebacterium zhongnanshanii TaxID=2768834 RepID=A0ABQ6VDQ3_9CORY|nr:restriction endonuclease subunit S [Corynebacterium zhongnanshanii]KAB3521029.1 hypothetical protein F8377_07385 [Corynebacterium zhongnanshanii]